MELSSITSYPPMERWVQPGQLTQRRIQSILEEESFCLEGSLMKWTYWQTALLGLFLSYPNLTFLK